MTTYVVLATISFSVALSDAFSTTDVVLPTGIRRISMPNALDSLRRTYDSQAAAALFSKLSPADECHTNVFRAGAIRDPLPKCFEHSEPQVSQKEADNFFQEETSMEDSSTSVASQRADTSKNAGSKQEKKSLDIIDQEADSLKRRWFLGGANRPWPNKQMYEAFDAYFEDWESRIFDDQGESGAPEHFQEEAGSSGSGYNQQHSDKLNLPVEHGDGDDLQLSGEIKLPVENGQYSLRSDDDDSEEMHDDFV